MSHLIPHHPEVPRRTGTRQPRESQQLGTAAQQIEEILRILNRKGHANLGPHQLADVAQDVLLVYWRKSSKLRHDESIVPWLYRVCCLELSNFVRRERRSSTKLGEPLLDHDNARAEAVDARSFDEHEDLYTALGRLSGKERAVVDLKHFGGLTFDQIGARLNLSPNTAKTRYYRALRSLRRILKTGGEPDAR